MAWHWVRGAGMKRKVDQIRDAWNTGDQIGALRIAARFFDRSAETKTFKRGMAAHNNPAFYPQIGKEPQQLIKTALNRFEVHDPPMTPRRLVHPTKTSHFVTRYALRLRSPRKAKKVRPQRDRSAISPDSFSIVQARKPPRRARLVIVLTASRPRPSLAMTNSMRSSTFMK